MGQVLDRLKQQSCSKTKLAAEVAEKLRVCDEAIERATTTEQELRGKIAACAEIIENNHASLVKRHMRPADEMVDDVAEQVPVPDV